MSWENIWFSVAIVIVVFAGGSLMWLLRAPTSLGSQLR